MPLNNRPKLICALVTALLLSVPACGAKDEAPPEIPIQELPPYTAEQRAVFDDSIAPEVFGLVVDGNRPPDPHFETRVRRADLIMGAKLLTITSDKRAGQVRYHIVLKPVGTPIVGYAPRENIEITVGRTSPSLTLLRSMATGGVGRKMLVFVKRFRVDARPVVHFRGEPDDQKLIESVQRTLRKPND